MKRFCGTKLNQNKVTGNGPIHNEEGVVKMEIIRMVPIVGLLVLSLLGVIKIAIELAVERGNADLHKILFEALLIITLPVLLAVWVISLIKNGWMN